MHENQTNRRSTKGRVGGVGGTGGDGLVCPLTLIWAGFRKTAKELEVSGLMCVLNDVVCVQRPDDVACACSVLVYTLTISAEMELWLLDQCRDPLVVV